MIMHEDRFRKSYTTERLSLRVLDESHCDDVLTFLNRGASVFDQYESNKASDFYTHSVQRKLLKIEYNLALQKNGIRFWIYRKEDPGEIIGTVSFSFYRAAPFKSIMIGYKILPDYWHQGYGTEAVKAAITVVSSVMNVSRVEAFVLPDNVPSQNLLARVGFRLEGTAYNCLEVQGIRRNHLQYSYTL
ncbi:MAG: GNAT family N-acetyltransferase [Lachnospiraceae bacterium]|nr:GNAT family N-acetyltransferase [Lachnospiraceae bacterium]